MRFLHLSDLHLGKRVNEFSMLEDQAYILKEILNIIDEQKVEAVLIAIAVALGPGLVMSLWMMLGGNPLW